MLGADSEAVEALYGTFARRSILRKKVLLIGAGVCDPVRSLAEHLPIGAEVESMKRVVVAAPGAGLGLLPSYYSRPLPTGTGPEPAPPLTAPPTTAAPTPRSVQSALIQ